jgi:hypothetical protein
MAPTFIRFEIKKPCGEAKQLTSAKSFSEGDDDNQLTDTFTAWDVLDVALHRLTTLKDAVRGPKLSSQTAEVKSRGFVLGMRTVR